MNWKGLGRGRRGLRDLQLRRQERKEFRNTEFFAFDGDRIKSIDVYFGASYENGVFVKRTPTDLILRSRDAQRRRGVSKDGSSQCARWFETHPGGAEAPPTVLLTMRELETTVENNFAAHVGSVWVALCPVRHSRPDQSGASRMSLTLHFHPLSSFCQKALIALYENDTPFTPNSSISAIATERAALLKLWPIGKFPVLGDEARNETIPESSIIIEYLDRHYPGAPGSSPTMRTAPGRRGCATASTISMSICRCRRSCSTGFGPTDKQDPHGVEEARAQLRTSYGMIEQQMAAGGWAMGEAFQHGGLRGGAGAVLRQHGGAVWRRRRNLTAYLERLKARPSVARVLKEAEPYFHMVPK